MYNKYCNASFEHSAGTSAKHPSLCASRWHFPQLKTWQSLFVQRSQLGLPLNLNCHSSRIDPCSGAQIITNIANNSAVEGLEKKCWTTTNVKTPHMTNFHNLSVTTSTTVRGWCANDPQNGHKLIPKLRCDFGGRFCRS